MLQDLLTMAGLRPNFGLHHLTWDQARKLNALMPKATVDVDPVRPISISLDTKNGRQALRCLSPAAEYEAGGEAKLATAMLKAADRFLPNPKTKRAVDAPLQTASLQTSGSQIGAIVTPAGLRTQAERLHCVC